MATWASPAIDVLWRQALAAIPLVLMVATLVRCLRCRPATRHSLWLMVLLWLVVASLLPSSPMAEFAGGPVAAAVGDQGKVTAAAALIERTGQRGTRVPAEESYVLPTGIDPSRQTGVVGSGVLTPVVYRPVGRASAPRASPVSFTRSGVSSTRIPRVADTTWLVPLGLRNSDSDLTAASHAPPTKDGWSLGDRDGEAVPWAAGMQQRVTGWVAGLAVLRDAISSLRPIPVEVWFAGVFLCVVIQISRSVRFGRQISAARPAPESVRKMVQTLAGELGLRKAPVTLMVDARVSPMVWCMAHPRLILPAGLWPQLDRDERRAVICHELAHLRRRDHLVRWAEAFVGSLYWWHPLVWRVRGRMHAEAESCCDAWVTSVLPRGRRAYAEALLTTRQYLSGNVAKNPVPAVGIGMSTGRTGRFTRRITMVMKGNIMPRPSISGLALTVVLAVVGWMAAPVWSAPPKEKTDTPCSAAAREEESTFERHMAEKGSSSAAVKYRLASAGDEGDDELEERLSDLESRLAELADHLAKLSDSLPAKVHEHALPRAFATPRAPRAPKAPKAPKAPRAPRASVELERLTKIGTIIRRYELPPGKLDALTTLMARDDVPILIRPLDDAIEVHATEANQVLFKHFVEMLDGSGGVRAYHLSKGKLHDLTELMGRSDVPILIEADGDSIRIHGNALEQAVFGAFARMIDPHRHHTGPRESGRISYFLEGDTDADEIIITADGVATKMARNVKARAKAKASECVEKAVRKAEKKIRKKVKRIRRRHTDHEHEHSSAGHGEHGEHGEHEVVIELAHREGLEHAVAAHDAAAKHAEHIRVQAEALEAEAERLMEQAEELEEEAEELEEQESEL